VVAVAAFLHWRPVFFVSIVDDSARDFLGDDFTALDFIDLAMMNKIYVRNKERDDNEGRGKER
jgi:hypothetical protein